MRTRFARHVLATDFIGRLQGKVPEKLAALKFASSDATREACLQLAANWRNERTRRDSYVQHANQAEQELSLTQIPLEVSSDIVEKVDSVFFSDPLTAAVKALGIH